jgi:hypothetical protein
VSPEDAERLRAELEKRLVDARATACRSNLARFRYRVKLYRSQHDGRPPPGLEDLLAPMKSAVATPLRFCPSDLEGCAAHKEGDPSGSSYEYFGPDLPERVARPDRFPVVWDAAPFHEGRRMVLFLDGRIHPVDEADFTTLLAAARALVAK